MKRTEISIEDILAKRNEGFEWMTQSFLGEVEGTMEYELKFFVTEGEALSGYVEDELIKNERNDIYPIDDFIVLDFIPSEEVKFYEYSFIEE